MIELAMPPLAYLLGSVSSAVIVSRLMKLPDPRHQGSGNPGATNVLRLGGKTAAALTLAGDIAKGALPVALALSLDVSDGSLAATGFAAFLGHLYPVFFGFKGGKGVATALGVLAVAAPAVAAVLVATWLATAALFRISSLAAIVAAAAAPVATWYLDGRGTLVTMCAAVSILLIWRHRANIRRLVAGEESRIGRKS